jgi:hypothetical protein
MFTSSNVSPEDFSIRRASLTETLDILNDPKLVLSMGVPSESNIERDDYYIITLKSYTMLFTLKEREGKVYEGHLAVPKASIRASRILALIALQWIFNKSGFDVNAVITSCPEGTASNLARKIGCTEVSVDKELGNGLNYFIYYNPSRGKL